MFLPNVKFMLSSPNKSQWPIDDLKEICIVGKSNVGKSTLINSLANNQKLARVSQTPGLTKLLNFFDVNGKFRIVDAPGYGYAKISFDHDKNFSKMMEEYIFERTNTSLFILLIDSRRLVSQEDLDLYNLFKKANKNVLIVATKADKLNQSEKEALKKNFKENFKDNDYFLISKDNPAKIEELLNYILKYV